MFDKIRFCRTRSDRYGEDIGDRFRGAEGQANGRRVPGTQCSALEGCSAQAKAIDKPQMEAVISAPEQAGLLSGKSGRIGGSVSPALIAKAKRQTGITTDTDLIEFALATVALEDDFAESFKKSRGKVDAELKPGY